MNQVWFLIDPVDEEIFFLKKVKEFTLIKYAINSLQWVWPFIKTNLKPPSTEDALIGQKWFHADFVNVINVCSLFFFQHHALSI